jgi:hypothetical protein
LRTLGSEGVLRIGGNTSERTLWRTQDDPAPREKFGVRLFRLQAFAMSLPAIVFIAWEWA